jgi:hypothetical protein
MKKSNSVYVLYHGSPKNKNKKKLCIHKKTVL